MAIRVAIEGYDELEQIGIGGMAAVYRARKVSIDKIVAIKVLFPYLATDEGYLERFQREAKAAASIQHENVVNVIDFGESDGAFYIVMEYYDGRTLEQLMKERPGLPPEISLRILLEVAYGLEAAHALDIVHRDVKPANIIYTNQGGIKIADFGLARKTDSMTLITQHGKVVGTPAYMSPEQAAGRPIGPPSDIFSFGVVAYELLGRRKPFEGQSYADVIEKIQTFEPSRVGIINPLISNELDQVVKRCLEKNEHARYKNAGELVVDLENAMEKAAIGRDRRQLAAYMRDPARYDTSFAEKTITECLSRGAFFMQKGKAHMDDAALEYRRVLFLDPSHERALSNLDRLRAQKGNGARTVQIDAVIPAAGARDRTPLPPVGKARPRATRGRVAGVAALVTLLGAGSWWYFSSSRTTREVAPQTALRGALPVESAAESTRHDLALTDSTSVAKVPPSEAAPTTDTKPPVMMSASSSDAGVARITDTTADTPSQVKDVPAARTQPRRDSASKPQLVTDSANAPPGGNDVRSRPAQAPTVEMGSLSVYFLGGVGDVWVDGKLFSHQPPFDRVPLPAGSHRVLCRMSEDKESHELTVTIRPGQETVVEYEVGGKPAVSNE